MAFSTSFAGDDVLPLGMLCQFGWVTRSAQAWDFFQAALDTPQLCLPKLAHIALYLDWDDGVRQLEDSAQDVSDALGKLVAAGILPALTQAGHFPSGAPKSSAVCS